jgi:transcriptional regulator with XRE-family HTH domain
MLNRHPDWTNTLPMTPMQKLVIERRAELDLSLRDVAARSGGGVSAATLSMIESGRHRWQFDDKTLRGIALGLDLPISKVRDAADVAGEVVEFRLPKRTEKLLTAADRRAIVAIAEQLAKAHTKEDSG